MLTYSNKGEKTMYLYSEKFWKDLEIWQGYAEEHWKCKDCEVMLNSDGVCPSCGYYLDM
jgi:rubrerythrin